MSRESKLQALLEEIVGNAIIAGRAARRRYATDPNELAAVMAYYDIIDVAKEQAEILGIKFADRTIASFDADAELLGVKKAA